MSKVFSILLLFFVTALSASEELFDIKTNLQCSLKQQRPGYVFQVSCQIEPKAPWPKLPQNYTFVLDRSNSISRHRFYLNKNAVASAIALLQPGDTFNILLFGGRFVSLFPKHQEWSKENLARARELLEHQPHGGILAATDLYTSLQKILANSRMENCINTAVLFSDGDTYLSLERQRQAISDYTKRNRKEVNLYCVASGEDNNLPLLELLSDSNRGSLIYAPKHEQILERTMELMRTLQNPIGNDLYIVLEKPTDSIVLQPSSHRLPPLYQGRPLTFFGSTNHLQSFNVLVYVNYGSQKMRFTIPIDLTQAATGSYCIERKWMQNVIRDLYDHYFEDGNVKHLELAKKLSTPLNISAPLMDK